MTILYLLIPVATGLGLVSLGAFVWSLRARQYEDLAGAAHRVLLDDDGKPPRQLGQQAPLDDGKGD